MKGKGHTLLALWAMVITTAHAAHCEAVPPGRSEAALTALRSQGAAIEYRDEAGGPGKIMITTDGRWHGGDAGLVALKDVNGLYKVRLGANVADAALTEVAGICGLTSLDIHSVAVTDAGVRHLAALPSLRRLNLTYTRVSDRGLTTFRRWTQLEWLGLSYTRVTRAGIEGLRRELPGTVIEGNPTQ